METVRVIDGETLSEMVLDRDAVAVWVADGVGVTLGTLVYPFDGEGEIVEVDEALALGEGVGNEY